jgi:hypothetical protein
VIAADGREAAERVRFWNQYALIVPIASKGYLESVHDEALRACRGKYVLRLDDDERISPAMRHWLFKRTYRLAPHWKFPRVHFWGDAQTVLLTPQLYPDWQTRLSHRNFAGGRTIIHCGSPFGGGEDAQVQIEHHKFLVRSFEDRLRIAEAYDAVMPGAGTGGMSAFSLPERFYAGEDVRFVPYQDGYDREHHTMRLGRLS